jgi:hypothetical protein
LILYTDSHTIAFYFDNLLYIFLSGLARTAIREQMELKTILYLAVLMNVKPFQKRGEICYAYLNMLKSPTDGVSTLSLWWGLSAPGDPESYAGGSVATGRATHVGQVKG